MQVGQRVLTKKDGKVVECSVVEAGKDDLVLTDGIETFRRNYWEIRKVQNEEK